MTLVLEWFPSVREIKTSSLCILVYTSQIPTKENKRTGAKQLVIESISLVILSQTDENHSKVEG